MQKLIPFREIQAEFEIKEEGKKQDRYRQVNAKNISQGESYYHA